MITHLPSSFLPQGLCICCSFCLVFFFYFCLVPSIIQISIQMLSLHRNFPWASYSCYPSLLLSHFMTSHCFIFFTLWNYCMYLYLFILFHTLEYKLHWNRTLFVSPEHKEHLAYSNCSTHICWGQVQCNIPHRNTLWVEDTKFCKHSKENECGQPGWSANLPEKLTLGSGSWRIKKR